MQSQGLRYFSSLTSKQKQETVNLIRIMKNSLNDLPVGLAIDILKNRDFDVVIKENDFIHKKLSGSKIFKHGKKYIPLNIKEII